MVWHCPGWCGIVWDVLRDSAMDAAITELDGLRLSDWIEGEGLSRSTAYELLKLLEIEPEARRVPTSRKPVSFLTRMHLQQLRPWALMLSGGTPLATIRRQVEMHRDRSGQSEIIPASSPGLSEIVPAITAALQPPADPLRCARALAEAATLGVPLSSAELAGVVGMSASTVSSWPDGHQPRPGFTLRRQKAGSAVWWSVERPGLSGTVQALPGPRSVGFGACLTVNAVSLPCLS
jgi:hypothetical protein